MTRKQKHLLFRIIIAAVLFAAGSLLTLDSTAEMAVFLVCYVVIGWDIVWKALTNILHGQVFDENFLMTIATIGALILGEHSEGVAVMLFYQVGEWFQSYAVSKSRKSIASLMDIRPDYANVERNGKLEQVDPEEVNIGDTIVVKPGERVPLDGKIIKGTSALDTSALTGESMPRDVEPGMEVISGCSMGNPLLQKFWTLWRMPAIKKEKQKTLSAVLPATTPRLWSLQRLPLQFCRLLSLDSHSQSGFTGR